MLTCSGYTILKSKKNENSNYKIAMEEIMYKHASIRNEDTFDYI